MTREDWLQERKKGIGASESACILGVNPYKTNVQLWEEKTGIKEAEDISNEECVKYGIEAESHLRELFKLDYPHYKVEYNEFKIICNNEHPFIFATLDGELTDELGKRGILEIKTTEIQNSMQWREWKDKLPDHYYAQILHQLLATGYEFVILKAQIKTTYGSIKLETRHYEVHRNEVEKDIEYLKEKLINFWNENILKDKKPNLILPKI